MNGMGNIKAITIFLARRFPNHGIQFILEDDHDNQFIERTNNQFKKIYLHDDILENLIFHRNSKNLHLSLSKSWPTQEEYTIDFLQVIGFEMTSCDFWGASPHILDFEYVENGRLISKLFSKRTEYDSFCALKQQKDYIETVLTFISGDTLTVACEEVVIGEAAL